MKAKKDDAFLSSQLTTAGAQRENSGRADAALSQKAQIPKANSKSEVDPAEIDALIQRGYLGPSDRDDLEALGAAVTACFSDALITP